MTAIRATSDVRGSELAPAALELERSGAQVDRSLSRRRRRTCRRARARPPLSANRLARVRVLAVGNMYPPHHLGGYELVWQSAVRHLRGRGDEVRVLTTDTRFDHAVGSAEQDVHRELRWWWRDHELPRFPLRERLAVERRNHTALSRHLAELRPEVVSWWAMGGMSLSLIERVRRAGIPAVGFVHDDWMVYGPHVDQWTRIFAKRPWARGAAERLFGIPASADLDSAARWLFVSETTRQSAIDAGRR